MIKCSDCNLMLDENEFYFRGNKRGKTYSCKKCHQEYNRNWYLKNKDKVKTSAKEWKNNNKIRVINNTHKLINSEGLEFAFFNTHKCEICGYEGKLVVDHCHKELYFRGMICGRCNSGLGFFRDNVKFLANAIKYLEK